MEPEKNKGKFVKPEEMEKKNIFKVPDGYFENLPMAIQARIERKKGWWETPVFISALKYAIPALVILMIAFFTIRQQAGIESPDALIAEVSTQDLIYFLEDSDITVEEILNNLNLQEIEFQLSPEDSGILELELDSGDLQEFYEEYELLNEYI